MTRRDANPLEPHLLPAARALYHLAKNECRGEKAARSKARLRQDLAARGHRISARDLDDVVRFVRNRADTFLVTTGAGVFWATSYDELLKADRYLTSRFDDLRTGHNAVQRKMRRWRSRPTDKAVPASRLPREGAVRQELLIAGT